MVIIRARATWGCCFTMGLAYQGRVRVNIVLTWWGLLGVEKGLLLFVKKRWVGASEENLESSDRQVLCIYAPAIESHGGSRDASVILSCVLFLNSRHTLFQGSIERAAPGAVLDECFKA